MPSGVSALSLLSSIHLLQSLSSQRSLLTSFSCLKCFYSYPPPIQTINTNSVSRHKKAFITWALPHTFLADLLVHPSHTHPTLQAQWTPTAERTDRFSLMCQIQTIGSDCLKHPAEILGTGDTYKFSSKNVMNDYAAPAFGMGTWVSHTCHTTIRVLLLSDSSPTFLSLCADCCFCWACSSVIPLLILPDPINRAPLWYLPDVTPAESVPLSLDSHSFLYVSTIWNHWTVSVHLCSCDLLEGMSALPFPLYLQHLVQYT